MIGSIGGGEELASRLGANAERIVLVGSFGFAETLRLGGDVLDDVGRAFEVAEVLLQHFVVATLALARLDLGLDLGVRFETALDALLDFQEVQAAAPFDRGRETALGKRPDQVK
ncbi:MAG: hypothetical protein R2862_06000 [Thermoanaerobaculia bacterium]